ncbi:exocyst complex component Sec10-like protein [Hysterangium stoloniferum]|nr:exocyst complex component Sec10-like protein [Hysterangium stoloniferum]
MDKWTTLEPVRLYSSATTGFRSRAAVKPDLSTYIGRLPRDLHLLIITYLPVYQIPSYSRGNCALSRLTRDEKVWEARWEALIDGQEELAQVLDELEAITNEQRATARARAPPTLSVDADDDFGDFASVAMGQADPEEMGDFVGSFTDVPATPRTALPANSTFREKYIRAHNLLKPMLASLDSPPHLILSNLFPSSSTTLRHQSQTLHLLLLYLSLAIQPLRSWPSLRAALRSAADRFEASLLTAFEAADGSKDEERMKEAAWSSWEVRDTQQNTEWEIGRVWTEKREVFYESGQWDPLKNFTKNNALDFDAMVEFMTYVNNIVLEQGSVAVRVFPPAANVLVMFAERISIEVISEYILPLLSRAREISNEIFLKATAASFAQAWRMVDVLLEVGGSTVSKTQVEDVIYRMFEQNMDEYLDEEVETVKGVLEVICRGWERKLATQSEATAADHAARFLGSQNPALMKRNVLASFTDILLLPVTIVPRTVNALVTTGSTAAVNGIAMLNPQRWGAQTANGYSTDFNGKTGELLFDDTDQNEQEKEEESARRPASVSSRTTLEVPQLTTGTTASSRSTSPASSFDRLELLLSLDIALELIHADRESLKRVETFQYYPGHYGHKVRETIEELFIIMLQVLSDRHISPGFSRATEQMMTYKPAEHQETSSVAPLLQFFELVHIGDTIQSMSQVYFDKEMAPHIDRTDFLNGVVREKKRFENALDDAVAAGLNAGTEVLMNQVEHIILTRTAPREYCPQEGTALELGPTKGCQESISCLEMHCRLMRGSTSKDVLEVFYQEVGIRLHAIIQKHLKRQIISLEGGFQVIADLNAYHNFVSSLKIPQVTSDFSNLKMLGHVFIVSDAKDLAQIVRDVTRYGGSFRPEDIYEFIQRRSDWKKIEKTVDKTMYNLSFKEDCTIS